MLGLRLLVVEKTSKCLWSRKPPNAGAMGEVGRKVLSFFAGLHLLSLLWLL